MALILGVFSKLRIFDKFAHIYCLLSHFAIKKNNPDAVKNLIPVRKFFIENIIS